MKPMGQFSGCYSVGLEALIRIQGGLCAYCFKPFGRRGKHRGWDSATREHVWPRAKGHGNLGNVVAACRRCNEDKGDDLPTGCEILALEWVNARREPGMAGAEPAVAVRVETDPEKAKWAKITNQRLRAEEFAAKLERARRLQVHDDYLPGRTLADVYGDADE